MSKIVQVGGKQYQINKFKATDGRKIIAAYPVTLAPKIGDYEKNEEAMVHLMSHVSVMASNGQYLPLLTKALIDNHVESWEHLVELEWETLKYNCPFMSDESFKSFAAQVKDFAANYLADLLEQAIGAKLGIDFSDSENK